ncbi:MAG TPA: carboxylesterase family protein [Actinocatenispora sp.]
MTKTVDRAPAVRVAGGRLRGRLDRGVTAFPGIPYAAPPFGARRMRPPEPPVRWSGERDSTGYGPTCPKVAYDPASAALFPEVASPGQECLTPR